MHQPLVSIIIPTYNRAHLIGETLDSVLAQTYTNWECIVVDDGSSDHTTKVVATYCKNDIRFQYHQRPLDRPKGANACRNYGFELSTGEYINWFDDDDIMLDNFLEVHLKSMIHKNIEMTICRLKVFKEERQNIIYKSKMKENHEGTLLKDFVSGDLNIGTPSVVLSRSILKKNKFDTSLSRAQELKFFFDLLSRKELKFELIHNFLVLVRRHNESITNMYNNLEISTLLSELKVRGEILLYAEKNQWQTYYLEKCLNLYLNPFSKLYLNFSLKYLYNELKLLANIFNKDKGWCFWKYRFISFLLIYKLTNRDYRLNQHVKKLKSFKIAVVNNV